MNELLGSVRRVILLEDRVTRLDASVHAMADKLSDTRDRVIRLEGLIEGAVRRAPYVDPNRSLSGPRE